MVSDFSLFSDDYNKYDRIFQYKTAGREKYFILQTRKTWYWFAVFS
jgi:hypothetical protein